MNPDALLQLLVLADAGLVDIGDKSRQAAEYRQRCRLIDHDGGAAVLLTRCRGSLGDILPGAGAPIARWYSWSVNSFEPGCRASRPPNLELANEVLWTLFGTHAEHAIATVDTLVPGSVAGVLFCDRDWTPMPAPRLPGSTWVAWPNRAYLEAMMA